MRRLTSMIEPVDIDIVRDRSVTVTFDDGMVCTFPVDALRSACPCATCRGLRERGEVGLAAPGSTRHDHHPARRAERRVGTVDRLERRAQHGHLRVVGAAPLVAGRARSGDGHRPRTRGSGRRRRSVAFGPMALPPPPAPTNPPAQPAAVAALLPPSRPRDRSQLHTLRSLGVQRLPGAGRRRLALPRVRQGRAPRHRHSCQVVERAPADADDLHPDGHQLRGVRLDHASPTPARSAAARNPSAEQIDLGLELVLPRRYGNRTSGTGWSPRASCTSASSTSPSTCWCCTSWASCSNGRWAG